jgi:Flp pilus assembly protein TadG
MAAHRDRQRHGEEGQILAIVAGGVIALLLLAGLVLDGGIVFVNRRDAQNAADLMAMAATKYVADVHTNTAQVDPAITSTWTALTATAEENDCDAAGNVPCTWLAWFVQGGSDGPVDIAPVTAAAGVPANALGVRVEVNRRPPAFIASLADIDTWNVTTEATAVAEQPSTAPAGVLLPIGMRDDPNGYEPGQEYDLTEGTNAPGNFGWLTWNGDPNTPTLETSLCAPNNPEMALPIDIDGAPGKHNSSGVRACLQEWMTTGQTVLIPIFDTVSGQGSNTEYHVIAVAAFVITGYSQPAVDLIQGHFVGIYNVNPVPAGVGAAPPQPGDTSYFLGLVR